MSNMVMTDFDRRQLKKEREDEIDRQDVVNAVPFFNSALHKAKVKEVAEETNFTRMSENEAHLNKTARSDRQWSFHNHPYIDLG
jgi:hypothetical protein